MNTKTTMAMLGMAILLCTGAVRAQGEKRIMATPLDSDSLQNVTTYATNSTNPISTMDQTLRMQVNGDQDRVGATYEVCNDPEHITCGNVTYVFPQLKVDRDSKAIMLGDEKVGSYGYSRNVRLENGYKLRSEIAQGETDTGFNRHASQHVKVFLEKTGQ